MKIATFNINGIKARLPALLDWLREAEPDVMVLEGQSSLRNPSGPCGAEFLLSGAARGVVLQHAVGREFYEGYEAEGYVIPPIEEEIELYADEHHRYWADVRLVQRFGELDIWAAFARPEG